MPSENSRPLSNQSTEKAFAVLELLARAAAPMRLRDISEALELNASTALRFLGALQRCGYAEQDPDTQRYRLTFKICRVANQMRDRTELQAITHPFLLELSRQIQEALCISVERDMSMVYIDVVVDRNRRLMSMQQVGNVGPMHSTGNGKLLLLDYSDQRLNDLIARKGLARYTEHTITTKDALLRELERIREAGYAVDNEENELGVRCMACPIRDYSGKIVSGVSITGPASRMTDEAMRGFLAPLRRTAEGISAALGWVRE